MYDSSGVDAGNEWIEIVNDGQTPTDISKWRVQDSSRHVINAPPKNGSVGSTTLQAGAFAIIANDAGVFATKYPNLSVSILDSSIHLPNAGGTISLLDATGKIVDSVSYGASMGAAGNGNSLQRTPTGVWVEALPTPGASNAAWATRVDKKTAEPFHAAVSHTVGSAQKAQAKSQKAAKSVRAKPAESLPPVAASEDSAREVAAVAEAVPNVISPWFLGMLGVVALGSVAVFASVRSKKDEWEILEETD